MHPEVTGLRRVAVEGAGVESEAWEFEITVQSLWFRVVFLVQIRRTIVGSSAFKPLKLPPRKYLPGFHESLCRGRV